MIMEEPGKTGWFRKAAERSYAAFTSPHNTAVSLIVVLLLLSFIAVDELVRHI